MAAGSMLYTYTRDMVYKGQPMRHAGRLLRSPGKIFTFYEGEITMSLIKHVGCTPPAAVTRLTTSLLLLRSRQHVRFYSWAFFLQQVALCAREGRGGPWHGIELLGCQEVSYFAANLKLSGHGPQGLVLTPLPKNVNICAPQKSKERPFLMKGISHNQSMAIFKGDCGGISAFHYFMTNLHATPALACKNTIGERRESRKRQFFPLPRDRRRL